MIDPERDQITSACYYTAPDKPYRLPGSQTDDLVVLAGHTWRRGDAAFNFLWDWQRGAWSVAIGDEVWVRTQASGNAWLVYRAVSLHTPDKDGGLASDESIWGTGPLPNRLLTIGCLQPSDQTQRSNKNVVVAWDFVRVREG